MFVRMASAESAVRARAVLPAPGSSTYCSSWTGDRLEFLGRNASPDHPVGLEGGDELSGRTGAGLDPCAALRTEVELAPGERAEVIFLLGQGRGLDEEARKLLGRYRAADCPREAARGRARWDDMLGPSRSRRPTRGLDLLLNRWLLYQTLGCRIWARSGFYQSGGAYGFRDQLQDVMALVARAAEPRARAPPARGRAGSSTRATCSTGGIRPTGRGVRTRFSDDLLWLPFAPCHYVARPATTAVLDEHVPFLERPPLARRTSRTHLRARRVADERGTLYEHCVRAARARPDVGPHGLPLMGCGDWNDGMNRVGRGARARACGSAGSCSCACATSRRSPSARRRRRAPARWRTRGRRSRHASRSTAWDGEWYRRAYFDDGTPLGSAQNDECRIDSIAQSLGGDLRRRRPRARARQAMEAVDELLVRARPAVLRCSSRRRSTDGRSTGLHQGLRARHPRERRPVHPRRVWVGAWPSRALGDGDEAGRAVRPAQPDPPRATPRGRRALGSSPTSSPPTSTARAARRPRRLDLVHRLGGLAVPRRARVDPRAAASAARRSASTPASRATGSGSRSATGTARSLRIVVENPRACHEGRRGGRARRQRSPGAPRCRSPTTARRTGCG